MVVVQEQTALSARGLGLAALWARGLLVETREETQLEERIAYENTCCTKLYLMVVTFAAEYQFIQISPIHHHTE